jgi:hypothetical protein
MNPAACARARKAERLAREAALDLTPPDPQGLPATPEDAYKQYRKNSRPFRKVFRGVITRKEAERFFISRARKTERAIQAAKELSS